MLVVYCCASCKYLTDRQDKREVRTDGGTAVYTCQTIGRCLKSGEVMSGHDSCQKFVLDQSIGYTESNCTEVKDREALMDTTDLYKQFLEVNGECHKIVCRECIFYGECMNYEREDLIQMAKEGIDEYLSANKNVGGNKGENNA